MVTLRSPIYEPGIAKLDMSENRVCPTFDGLSWFIMVYHGLSWLYHGHITVISWDHLMVISWLFHVHLMVISWSYHGHLIVISWLFHGHLMVISWSYHGYIMVIYGYTMVILWLYMVIPWLYHDYIMVYHGYILVISWFIIILFWSKLPFFSWQNPFSSPFWNPAVLSLGSQGWASSGLHCSWEFCEGANVWDLQVSSVSFRTVPNETCKW